MAENGKWCVVGVSLVAVRHDGDEGFIERDSEEDLEAGSPIAEGVDCFL